MLPNHSISIQDLSIRLKAGLPWHNPELSYESWRDPIVWWENIEGLFAKVYQECGVDPEHAKILSRMAHDDYIKPEEFYVYPDSIEVLQYFKDHGWSNAILSNNVPELPQIVDALGFTPFIDICVSSASIGYEKPNRLFFERAMGLIGEMQDCWMVGDSYAADIKGAEAVGIKSIQVRREKVEGVIHYSPDLLGVKEIIEP